MPAHCWYYRACSWPWARCRSTGWFAGGRAASRDGPPPALVRELEGRHRGSEFVVRLPLDTTADVTAASTGTNYTTSNPAIAQVSASGLVADAGDGVFTQYVLKPLIVQRLLRHHYADLAQAVRRAVKMS